MHFHLVGYATLAASFVPFLAAQSSDTPVLKQVIIFGRHGVRTRVVANSTLMREGDTTGTHGPQKAQCAASAAKRAVK